RADHPSLEKLRNLRYIDRVHETWTSPAPHSWNFGCIQPATLYHGTDRRRRDRLNNHQREQVQLACKFALQPTLSPRGERRGDCGTELLQKPDYLPSTSIRNAITISLTLQNVLINRKGRKTRYPNDDFATKRLTSSLYGSFPLSKYRLNIDRSILK